VREEVERAQPLLEGKPVTLELEQRARFALRAPPRVFAAMIGNLIRNACLYTESGGVRVRIDEDSVSVADSGIGMSADEIAQTHQPYFRAGRSASAGHGVGLSIVRRLSERFGWPVDLRSEIGAGTVATIHFPQRLPAPAVAS
jgi:signal transduction histidine kinase